jgi:hypothetical protein
VPKDITQPKLIPETSLQAMTQSTQFSLLSMRETKNVQRTDKTSAITTSKPTSHLPHSKVPNIMPNPSLSAGQGDMLRNSTFVRPLSGRTKTSITRNDIKQAILTQVKASTEQHLREHMLKPIPLFLDRAKRTILKISNQRRNVRVISPRRRNSPFPKFPVNAIRTSQHSRGTQATQFHIMNSVKNIDLNRYMVTQHHGQKPRFGDRPGPIGHHPIHATVPLPASGLIDRHRNAAKATHAGVNSAATDQGIEITANQPKGWEATTSQLTNASSNKDAHTVACLCLDKILVLWHVPVEAHRVEGVKNFMLRIYESDVKSTQTLTYDQAWTPMKRLASVMETAPEDASMTEDAA